jgi:hypothetical protein
MMMSALTRWACADVERRSEVRRDELTNRIRVFIVSSRTSAA